MLALALVASLASGQLMPPSDEEGWVPVLSKTSTSPYAYQAFFHPLTYSADLPACSADPNCLLDVYPVANSDGGTWVTASLADAGSFLLNNPAANGFEAAPMVSGSGTVYAAKDIADGTAPYISAADAQTILGSGFYGSDFTIMCAVHPTTAASATPVLMSHGLVNVDGIYIQTQSDGRHRWTISTSGSNQQQTVASTNLHSRWSVVGVQRSGSTYVAFANGTELTGTAITVTAASPASRNLYLGRYDSTALAMRGGLHRCRWYNSALSQSMRNLRTAQMLKGLAVRPSDTYVTTTRASAAFDVYADGYVYASGDNLRIPHSTKGLPSFSASTNLWPSPMDASAWTSTGTPVITTNQESGLLSRYNGSAECDDIEDDDAAATEAKETGAIATSTGEHVVAPVLKHVSGATGMRLQMISTTPANTVCTFSGIDNPASATCSGGDACAILCQNDVACNAGGTLYPGNYFRPVCQVNITAGATVRGFITLGAVASDVGKVRVCYAGMHRTGAAGARAVPPITPITTAIAADSHTAPTTGWPTTSGEVSVVYTPNSGSAPSVIQRLLDSRTTSTTQGLVLQRSTSNTVTLNVYGAAEVCAAATAALTWTAGVAKTIEARWSDATCEILVDGVSAATGVASGSPSSHDAAANLGASLTGVGQADGWLRSLCVGRPGACP